MSIPLIYLASASPRRRELLHQIHIPHAVLQVAVDESWNSVETPAAYVSRLALDKARTGWLASDQSLPVLGADTAVVLDGQILGKPLDREHGLTMLARLSGRSHQVFTAVALLQGAHSATRLSVSQVIFTALSDTQRQAYWDSFEGRDKAGGYAIQGRAAAFVTHLAGSYSGVMGLPLFETVQLLREFGVALFPPAFTYSAKD